MAEKNTVVIDLLGQRLPIRTDQAPEEVQRVANTLAERLEAVRSGAGTIDSLRLALLTALDLSRELLRTKQELALFREEATERTLALVEAVEAGTTFHEAPPNLTVKPGQKSKKDNDHSGRKSASGGTQKPSVLV